MAITITAKLDSSGVKVGAREAADALSGMASQAESSNDKLDQVAKELFDDLGALKNRTDALKGELAEMSNSGANSLGKVEDAAEEAGQAVDSIGGGGKVRESITAISTGYLALVDVAKKFVEVGAKAVEVVQKLADDGNPAALELADSLGQVKLQLLEMAENPMFQEIFSDIADLINSELIPAIKEIPGTIFEMVASSQLQVTALKESLGLVAEGTTDLMERMQETARGAMRIAEDASKQQREERKRLAELAKVNEELAKIEEEKNAAATASALEQVKTEGELRDVIDDLTESIRSQAKEGKLSDEEKVKSLRTIKQAEERIKKIREDNAASEKELANESVKVAGDASKDRQRIASEEAAEKGKLAQAELDRERMNIEERKRLVMGGNINGAEKVLGAQSREEVRNAFAQRQADQQVTKSFASGASAAEIAAQRQRALKQAQRDFDNGKADASEVRAAQVDLAEKSVNTAVSQGKASKETAAAVKESIAELARVQNEMDQVQAEIAAIKNAAKGVADRGNRRRAQIQGAGQ